MADDVAPAEQDQPIDAPEAPETDQPSGGEESFTDFDPSDVPEELRGAYEEAYKRLQGAYTKKTQSLAEERREAEQARQIFAALQNPQTRNAALQQFGIEMVEDDEEPDEEPDLYDRIDRLEGQLTQREQAEQQARQEEAVVDYIVDGIAALEKKAGQEFDAEEHEFLDIVARAKAAPDGRPDIEGAYQLLGVLNKKEQQRIVKGKTNTPRPPGGGKPGSRRVDPSKETPEQREERLVQAADEARGSLAA